MRNHRMKNNNWCTHNFILCYIKIKRQKSLFLDLHYNPMSINLLNQSENQNENQNENQFSPPISKNPSSPNPPAPELVSSSYPRESISALSKYNSVSS